MPRLRLDSHTDAARWHLIFMLLSMEKTAPLWAEMGLKVQVSAALRESARAFVREYRLLAGDASLTDENRLAAYCRLLEETFNRLAREEGDEVARALARWGTETFQYETERDAQAFLWRRLLRRLATVTNQAYPLVPVPLPPKQLASVKAAVRHHLGDSGELHRRIKAAEQAGLSRWDAEIYATYTLGASPMDWVENTIEFVKTRLAWQDIQTALSDEQLEALETWGKRQAEAMEMDPALITLPDFSPSRFDLEDP